MAIHVKKKTVKQVIPPSRENRRVWENSILPQNVTSNTQNIHQFQKNATNF